MKKLPLIFILFFICLLAASCQAAPDLRSCGISPSDWCAAPEGDPCGRYKTAAQCKSDPQCQGMRYRGESVVACQFGPDGYATNCPTVGCLSRCEKLNQKQCVQSQGMCRWSGTSCSR